MNTQVNIDTIFCIEFYIEFFLLQKLSSISLNICIGDSSHLTGNTFSVKFITRHVQLTYPCRVTRISARQYAHPLINPERSYVTYNRITHGNYCLLLRELAQIRLNYVPPYQYAFCMYLTFLYIFNVRSTHRFLSIYK